MEVLDTSLEDLALNPEDEVVLHDRFNEMENLMKKMGYSRILSFSGQQRKMPKSPFPMKSPVTEAEMLAQTLEESLENGNEVVYLSFDDWDFFEARMTSVELTGKHGIKNLNLRSAIFEEGEIIEKYDLAAQPAGVKNNLPNDYVMVADSDDDYGMALNALGIKQFQQYGIGKGYASAFRFSFEDKIQMWFHNECFIPIPFNCDIPSIFVKNIRQSNVKV